MNKDYFGITDSLIKAVEEATKPHTVPKTDKDKKLAALAHPKDKITHKDVMVGRGVVAKEEAEHIEEETPNKQQVKQAIGIARDKRYAKGNVTGAVKAMDKLNKGLAQHPAVKKELQKQNEATSAYARIDARFKKLSGRSMGAAAKEYGDEAKKLQKEIDAQQAENERRKAAMKTEEVEPIEELSKTTLASYAKKATHDARMKMAAGKDFERVGAKTRKPEYKAGAKKWEDRYKSDARRREAGTMKAIDRLAKEEVELDEISNMAHAKYRSAARADIRTQSKKLDADNKASDRIQKRVDGLARSTGLERVKKMTKEEFDQIDEVSSYTKVGKLVRKFIPGQGQKQAGERSKDQGYSASLDREALKYHPDDKKLSTTMKSSEKAQQRYKRISRGESPFKSSPNDTNMKEETDTPGNSYEHQCAIHVKHAKLGEGRCLTTQHADADDNGNIEWYDVMFEEGIARVPTDELEILVSESHMHSRRKKVKDEEDEDDEMERKEKKEKNDD